MKQLLWALLIPVLFFSCSKDDPNNRIEPYPTEGEIMMDVNGYAWAAPRGYTSRFTSGITIYGQQNQNSTVNLNISPYNGVQTYPLNGITKITFYEDGVEYTSISGMITIVSDDANYVQGSFYGEVVSNGAQSLQLANGQFSIPK